MKRVLLIGGTGVMGTYLTSELLHMGFQVDVASLDNMTSQRPDLRYFQGNCKDDAYLKNLLNNDYHCIVDFLVYSTEEFRQRHVLLLRHTDHMIYLSSYRVYADKEFPIRETSPRLLEVSQDKDFLASDNYALCKARGEDILKASGFGNWTIIRPAITYSHQRVDLTVLSTDMLIRRARFGKPLVVPRESLKKESTLTWGGDVAKMIARLVCNRDAFGQVYTTATAQHQPWQTVAGYYEKLLGLKYIPVDMNDFLSIPKKGSADDFRWMLLYDRMFDRIVDNSKILNITGLKQSELMPLYQGLERELARMQMDRFLQGENYYSDQMDIFLETRNLQ